MAAMDERLSVSTKVTGLLESMGKAHKDEKKLMLMKNADGSYSFGICPPAAVVISATSPSPSTTASAVAADVPTSHGPAPSRWQPEDPPEDLVGASGARGGAQVAGNGSPPLPPPHHADASSAPLVGDEHERVPRRARRGDSPVAPALGAADLHSGSAPPVTRTAAATFPSGVGGGPTELAAPAAGTPHVRFGHLPSAGKEEGAEAGHVQAVPVVNLSPPRHSPDMFAKPLRSGLKFGHPGVVDEKNSGSKPPGGGSGDGGSGARSSNWRADLGSKSPRRDGNEKLPKSDNAAIRLPLRVRRHGSSPQVPLIVASRRQSMPGGSVAAGRVRRSSAGCIPDAGDSDRSASTSDSAILVKMLQARISEERDLREAAEDKFRAEHLQVDALRGQAAKNEKPVVQEEREDGAKYSNVLYGLTYKPRRH